MTKVFAIAYNTFREAVRNRVLYVLLFFSILIMFGAWVASSLSIDDHTKIVRDLGVGAINIISLLITIFVGIGLVYNDLDKKTIYTIISKPISRWQFLLGKYFGLLLTIAVNVFIMTWIFCAVLHFREAMTGKVLLEATWKSVGPDQWEYLGAGNYLRYIAVSTFKAVAFGLWHIVSLGTDGMPLTAGLFSSSLLTVAEMAVITAFAVLFSSFSSPTLTAFLTVGVFIIGRLNQDLYLFADTMVQKAGGMDNLAPGQKLAYFFAMGAAYLMPNLEVFNVRGKIAEFTPTAFTPVPIGGIDLLYGAAYCAAVLAIATIIFNRRNFK